MYDCETEEQEGRANDNLVLAVHSKFLCRCRAP